MNFAHLLLCTGYNLFCISIGTFLEFYNDGGRKKEKEESNA